MKRAVITKSSSTISEEAGEGRCVGPLNNYVSGSKPKACSILHANSLYSVHPRRIAVITSPSGAVIRDILSVLMRRFPLVEIELLPSLVQGDTAAAQITHLLRGADSSGRYDAILIARGGGSLEDLWAFNNEQLARTIAAAHTPVISAIGHETDFTLADFAARHQSTHSICCG